MQDINETLHLLLSPSTAINYLPAIVCSSAMLLTSSKSSVDRALKVEGNSPNLRVPIVDNAL